MGQSFTSGGGLLSAISINIISIESSSSSPLYEMSIFSGTPSPTCGYAGLSTTTCAYADFGIPIATALVAVKSTGQNKLFFHSPVYLTAGEVYTFTLNPTTNTQSFRWSGQDGLYAGGQSFGINGSVSISGYDYSFQTHYLSSGWRAL
jgi:hypothetical protein